MENQERENIEIDLKRTLFVLWHHVWIIVLIGVLCAATAFGCAWFIITPTYSASTQLYVNNIYVGSAGVSSSQLVAAQDLAETYMVILKSRSVLETVAQKSGLDYSYEQLKDMVDAASVNGTEVFQVTVTGTNYKHVAKIANTIADVLPEKITAVVEGNSVRVVDYAVENPEPVGPSYQLYLLLGAVFGMLLASVAVVVADVLDTTINSEDYLGQAYGKYPLLAVIPDFEDGRAGYGARYKGSYESRPVGKQGGASK